MYNISCCGQHFLDEILLHGKQDKVRRIELPDTTSLDFYENAAAKMHSNLEGRLKLQTFDST